MQNLLGVAIPTFGEQVEYRLKAGGCLKIVGIFDNEFQQVDPDTERVVASNLIVLGIRLSDLPGPPVQGDLVVRLGVEYKVTDSQEDGHGGTTLVLHRND